MASALITQYDAFNPSKISYGAPRVNARGGKSIKVLDEKRNTLILSTPLILTWGVNKMEDEDTGRVSYNLAIQFPSDDYSNDKTRMLFEKMKAFENKILDDAVTHSKEWFGKSSMSREVAEALFSSMLKYPKDKVTQEPDMSRAPSMRIKIPYWEGKFNVELYNLDSSLLFNSSMDMQGKTFESLIPKGSHIAAAVQCNGIWYAAGKFGVTWQLVQAIVRTPTRLQGGCFLTLNQSDMELAAQASKREEEAAAAAGAESAIPDEVEDTQVEDSDEEDEPAPEPAPAPKKTKRRVVKKKKSSD